MLGKQEADSLGASGASKDGSLQVYKVMHTGIDGKYQMLGCVTRSGPWLAQISRHESCNGGISHALAPFNGFQPQLPGSASTFPPILWDGTPGGLPANYGWATDMVPWSTPMLGGRCTQTQLTSCPGEHVGQIPGDEPDPPVIF